MRNWLGQDIVPGSVVYRGAREGNSSSYKIGTVESIKDGKARVAWQYEPGRLWRKGPVGTTRDYVWGVHEFSSKGSPALDSLILLSEDHMAHCKAVVELGQQWQNGDMPVATYRMLVDNLNIV